ncbi:hypothetical protein VTO42DRAFT_6633 [Malbranchea cinnamomea]
MDPGNGVAQAAPPPSTGTSGLDMLAEVMQDDTRSSSLSDIDDRLDSENIDFSPQKLASEVDSEAETERIEDSPHRTRNRASIVLSADSYGTSPSKLAQSTTYDDLEDEGDNDNGDNENDETEVSPSKPSRSAKSNGVVDANDSNVEEDKLPSPQEVIGKKRKRIASVGDIGERQNADEPSRKRRGSVPITRTSPSASGDLRLRHAAIEPSPKVEETSNEETFGADEEEQEVETRSSPVKRKKGKKATAKKKGKKTKDVEEDGEVESNAPENGVAEETVEEEDNAETVGEADDAEAASKLEESIRKANAMDTLTTLEQQFATLRDRIYDERIANLNRELAQLEQPNPTHPEYLRQLEIITKYRDEKIKYENTLFQFKLQSLMTKSRAERSQINSTYFQRIREIREAHLERLARYHCQIQQDRFQIAEASPEYSIPFPTRRSTQAAQQAAYNQEVSVLSGFAKYVGFPASPAVPGLTRQEIDEDLIKMGIRRPPPAPQYGAGSADDPHG